MGSKFQCNIMTDISIYLPVSGCHGSRSILHALDKNVLEIH